MDDKTIHDLAVAYAQAKLIQSQEMHPEQSGYDEELRLLLKSYNYALHQLPVWYDALDEHF